MWNENADDYISFAVAQMIFDECFDTQIRIRATSKIQAKFDAHNELIFVIHLPCSRSGVSFINGMVVAAMILPYISNILIIK